MDNKDTEAVLVFPKSLIDTIGSFQGLSFNFSSLLSEITNNYLFMDRSIAESNSNYKQLVSYVIFVFNRKVFSYQRSYKEADDRLRGCYSIGIGGHYHQDDTKAESNYILKGIHRELDEELIIKSSFEGKTIGIINDDSNNVGRVHLGIIHINVLNTPDIEIKTNEIINGDFVSVENLKASINLYENWSQICIQHIDKMLEKFITPS